MFCDIADIDAYDTVAGYVISLRTYGSLTVPIQCTHLMILGLLDHRCCLCAWSNGSYIRSTRLHDADRYRRTKIRAIKEIRTIISRALLPEYYSCAFPQSSQFVIFHPCS